MNSTAWKLLRPAALALLGLAAAMAIAACGDDDDKGSSASSTTTQVLTAINILDNAGLHEMDEELNEQGEIPANGETVARHLEAVVRLTDWPSNLEGTANRLAGLLHDLATEFDKDNIDVARAGELAAQVHDTWHDLSHDTWAYLAEQAGIEGEAGDSHQ